MSLVARWSALVLIALLAGAAALGHPHVAAPRPLRAVGDGRVVVRVPGGTGEIPIYANLDWTKPLPDVTRAVVMLHGLNRNANTYFASAVRAQQAAGDAGQHSLLLAPQFLADEDIAANSLPPDMLHWGWNDWSGGRSAHGPAPASSFDAIDAILARLADRRIFPHLAQVVLAGHSAGGQVVQRYAVVGNGDAALHAIGVSMRYVVANPSSYVYFSVDRPVPVLSRRMSHAVNRWEISGSMATCRPMPARLLRHWSGATPRETSPICWAAPIQTRICPCSTDPARRRRRATTIWIAASPISATCNRAKARRWRKASIACGARGGAWAREDACSPPPAVWPRCSTSRDVRRHEPHHGNEAALSCMMRHALRRARPTGDRPGLLRPKAAQPDARLRLAVRRRLYDPGHDRSGRDHPPDRLRPLDHGMGPAERRPAAALRGRVAASVPSVSADSAIRPGEQSFGIAGFATAHLLAGLDAPAMGPADGRGVFCAPGGAVVARRH